MTKEELISQITSTISANGNQDITGTKLQEVLVSIVDTLYSAIDEATIDASPEDFTELILQTLGTRVDATMSQKAITDALTALNYGINAIPVFARIERTGAESVSLVNSSTALDGEIVYVTNEHPYFQEGFYWKASDNKYYTWFGDAHLYKVDVNTPVRYNKLFECAEDGKQYVIVTGSTTAKPNLVILGTDSGSTVVESNDIPKFNGIIDSAPNIISAVAPTYEGIYFSVLDYTFVAKLGTDYYASWDTSHLYKDGPGVIESRLFEYNRQLYMYDGKALNLLSNAPKMEGYTYISTATPSTTPITITGDEKVFYIATEEGLYSNFGVGNISELSIIKSENGSWMTESFSDFSKLDRFISVGAAENPIEPYEMENSYLNINGVVVPMSGFRVSKFQIDSSKKYKITSKIGGGDKGCLLHWRDADGGFISYDGAMKDYGASYEFIEAEFAPPSNARFLYVECTDKYFDNFAVKEMTEKIDLQEYIRHILEDITNIQKDITNIQKDITAVENTPLSFTKGYKFAIKSAGITVPEATADSNYAYIKIESLSTGDSVKVHARGGSSAYTVLAVKENIVVEIIARTELFDGVIDVDDKFDTLIINNYYGYLTSPSVELQKIVSIKTSIEHLDEKIEQLKSDSENSLNILCLGNSFTQDSMGYFPWIFKELAPDIKLNVYMVYQGGAPIAQYLAWVTQEMVTIGSNTYHPHGDYDLVNDSTEPKYYSVYKYEDGAVRWTSQSGVRADDILNALEWDIITIQQNGEYNYRPWESYYKPYIYKLLKAVSKKIDHPFRFGYIMSHASYSLEANVLQERYASLAANAERVLNDTPIEIILPYATAIQNARTTYLNQFGADENHHMMSDTAHLQDGIPCLTACYANVMAILQAIGQNKSIIGSQIIPTYEWCEEHNVPANTSTSNGLTEENIYLAQQCAVMAVKKPLQLSNMVELGMADS